MVAEFGVFALLLSLMFSILLTVVPALGLWTQRRDLCVAALQYVRGQFVCLLIAYSCLTWCFLQNDFTVRYVLVNSSLLLPWFYKACAVWGGHEGSMLLWVLVLSGWTLAVSIFSKSLALGMRVRVLVIMGALAVGFLLFLLVTSNPFTREFQLLVTQGRDLNPLLQDPGFLFHPPVLYMGYVGFSVPFAFAIATLWRGNMPASFAKWTRPWALAAWCFLTLGITLGSWWAYRELGWGGFWFWDPVENASFMPWLVGTALLHSLVVCEKRNQFLGWTVLLAITAFSLSLIGTFLVRSGVLTSVHAFAVDPERGVAILILLLVVMGGSLLLFAVRAHTLPARPAPGLISRESALFLNNLFLMVAMLTVLLGTLYPLLIDALGLGKLSVGAPYFNAVFIPIMIPLFIIMGFGVHWKWKEDNFFKTFKMLSGMLFLSLFLPICIIWLVQKRLDTGVITGVVLASWVITSTLYGLIKRIHQRGWSSIGNAYAGMFFAHIGVAVTVLGIAVSSGFGIEREVRVAPGDTAILAGIKVKLLSESPLVGENYHGRRVLFQVQSGGRQVLVMPEKRRYDVGGEVMTEAAIDVTAWRDLYIALGEPLGRDAWSVRIYYKPLVRLIWAGGLLMFLGGILALTDRRYAFKIFTGKSKKIRTTLCK